MAAKIRYQLILALSLLGSVAAAEPNMRSFVKLLKSPDHGSMFLKYDYVGEPMIAPARLEARIFCDGDKAPSKIIKISLCSLDQHTFDPEVGELAFSYSRGFLFGMRVVCEAGQQEEITVAKICRELKRKK